MVSVTADSAQHDRVIAVLERYNPLDLDDRGRQSEFGATDTTTSATGNDVGSTTSAYGTTTAAYGTTADRERDLAAGSAATGAMAGRAEPDLTANRDVASERSEGERVIQLAEEQLQVGKRVVETGRTRIRRYVVETPVEERIRLRTERVVIERRRPVSGSGLSPDAFTETTTDVVERSEQPIVSKTARIGEEVVVRTDADEREETVRDTVRREDVEVTQAGTETNVTGRTAGTRPATPTTTAGTTGTTGTGRT
ncbi:MAG: YsnF/AvaK domain-containing protein [Acidisphaera sp.]|nr:YsnF/AvaK domain-containing protein [Acidisphaera sp.]MBV9813960.1 YsnF/AvaK domain-containing protein [Acetobacteraceae bacterium]